MQNIKICPYPGLRPFNENESIYFKGRDEHIEEIIHQLEQNKFIMLTGASGDGKSSLVYAGVIPNARAGFFKAKFNNWIVADFRPERNPLKNLAKTISKNLNINDDEKAEEELSFGFSSLIQLYKSSPHFLDTNSEEYKGADDASKKDKKKKAANLIILVDQFEEFFTNIENFNNDTPSLKAQTVINLLLETARIALSQDIPIYIICTMRSDYIGQCAAFHGLPEYIGFSQFFVPRLKRKEIQQVIEEPAKLSGCKISNRLTQILINELGEGFDQLPVLQHALNQLWHEADNGNEEMDMIHLAKLGGMPPQLLSEEAKIKFEEWFSQLSSIEQELLKNTSLENLLNSHANELYYRDARSYYNKNHAEEISDGDASLIIKTAFQCLTRIDHSRAVRNRMTLQEITDIINKPAITTDVVAGVLDIFRLEGNTFLRPFITDDPETQKLHPDTVLDITHESLIRNWQMLHEWAKEEYKNYVNFLDFNKQLQRWVENKKSSGYLLPIGPLTFFEKWFNDSEPNKYWLKKYDDSDEPDEIKLGNASSIIDNSEEFIMRSARKLFVTRTVLKYGANRIATVVGIILLVAACTYYYLDFRRKQNDYVLKEIAQRCIKMLPNNEVQLKTKSSFLFNYALLNPGVYSKLIRDLHNDTLAFDLGLQIFNSTDNSENLDSTRINVLMDSVLNDLSIEAFNLSNGKNNGNDNAYRRIVDFVYLLKNFKVIKLRNNKTDSLFKFYLEKIFSNYVSVKLCSANDSANSNTSSLIRSIKLLLYNNYDKNKIYELLTCISPFEGSQGFKRFNKLFPIGGKAERDYRGRTQKYNKGYELLAYLYACEGSFNELNRCTDSILLKYKFDINIDDEDFNFNNTINSYFNSIISYLEIYHLVPSNDMDVFLERYKTAINSIYSTGLLPDISESNINTENKKAWNKIINDKLWNYYIENIKTKEKGADKLNFRLAYEYKKHGIQIFGHDSLLAKKYFKMSLEYYFKTSAAFRSSEVKSTVPNSEGIKYSDIFLFPTVISYQNTSSDEDISCKLKFNWFAQGPIFQKYLLHQKQFEIFSRSDEFKLYNRFLFRYFERTITKQNRWSEQFEINYSYFEIAQQMIDSSELARQNIDQQFIYLVNTLKYFKINDTSKAFNLMKKIDLKYVLSPQYQKQTSECYNNNDCDGRSIDYIFKNIAQELTIHDHIDESFQFINAFTKPDLRRNALIAIAWQLEKSGFVQYALIYLDTLYKDIDKMPRFGTKLVEVNAMVGSQAMYDLSMKLIKKTPDNAKPSALLNYIRGISFNGFYYYALTSIPDYVSTQNEMLLYNQIVEAEVMSNKLTRSSRVYSDEAERNFWDFYSFDYEAPVGTTFTTSTSSD